MKRLVLGLGLVALAVISAACSGGSGGSASAPAASAPAASAPAGDAITVSRQGPQVLDGVDHGTRGRGVPDRLRQPGSPHPTTSPSRTRRARSKFKGEIVTSTKITYDVPALAAGAYEFFCEVHPDMKGTLTAG